ncbi:MAG: hypothetical protein AABW80_03495 [Nanoarchaeota archaeon]
MITLNKQAKNTIIASSIFVITLSFLFLASFVAADFPVWTNRAGDSAGNSTSGNITTINEDVYVIMNFTVNETLSANITSVNVTLPSSTLSFGANGFRAMLRDTSGTYVAWNSTFNYSASTANWTNTSVDTGGLIPNLSSGKFQFNLTGSAPGKYNISIDITNHSSVIERNLTIHINDTTAPYQAAFILPSETYITKTEVLINISANDTHSGIGSANISLYNTNGTATYTNVTTSHAGGGLNDTIYTNFSGAHILEGFYLINVTLINDNSDLINLGANTTNTTGIQKNITIDWTAPSVTLAKNAVSTNSKLVIDVTVSDATSGVVGKTCSVSGGGTNQAATISGSGSSQTVTQTGLSCSSSYTYTVTCTDAAGNSGTTITAFSSDSCTGGGSFGGSSGGSSAGTTTWANTFVDDSQDIEDKGSVAKTLGASQRVRISVSGTIHHVGVKSLTSTTATIEVASTPQEATMSVGETRKFDLDSNRTYDISVKLNSIIDGKADVTILPINEAVTAESEATQQEAEDAATGADSGAEEKSGSSAGKIIGWIIVAIVVIGLIAWFVARRKN